MNIIKSCIQSSRGFELMDITRLFFSLYGYVRVLTLNICICSKHVFIATSVAMIVMYCLLGHAHLMLLQT